MRSKSAPSRCSRLPELISLRAKASRFEAGKSRLKTRHARLNLRNAVTGVARGGAGAIQFAGPDHAPRVAVVEFLGSIDADLEGMCDPSKFDLHGSITADAAGKNLHFVKRINGLRSHSPLRKLFGHFRKLPCFSVSRQSCFGISWNG